PVIVFPAMDRDIVRVFEPKVKGTEDRRASGWIDAHKCQRCTGGDWAHRLMPANLRPRLGRKSRVGYSFDSAGFDSALYGGLRYRLHQLPGFAVLLEARLF